MEFESLSSVPNILQNAAILTVIVAFIGYALTFISAHMLAQRRDKLELVNKRLNEFYGPLYVASEERRSTIGWPPEFDVYVRESYARLKAEQMDLMQHVASRMWRRLFRRR